MEYGIINTVHTIHTKFVIQLTLCIYHYKKFITCENIWVYKCYMIYFKYYTLGTIHRYVDNFDSVHVVDYQPNKVGNT